MLNLEIFFQLWFSPDHPTFVCNACETNLRAAAKIRNDITQIEKCWDKYIEEMPLMNDIKIEEVDDESMNFETVEMTIEPVDQMYTSSSYDDGDGDYLDMDLKPKYGNKYETCSYDGDTYESISDLDDTQQNITSIAKIASVAEKHNCEHCNTSGLTQTELRIHQQSCHPETLDAPQFKCDICLKIYSSRYGIRTHMKRHMQGSTEATSSKRIKRYKCSSCEERFSKKVLLVEHELRHSGVSMQPNFSCLQIWLTNILSNL